MLSYRRAQAAGQESCPVASGYPARHGITPVWSWWENLNLFATSVGDEWYLSIFNSPRLVSAFQERIGGAWHQLPLQGGVGRIRANPAPVNPKNPWNWVERVGQTAWRGSSLPERMLTLQTGLCLAALPAEAAVRFTTAAALVNELVEARQNGHVQRLIARWMKHDLIALDEVGYVPLAGIGAGISLPRNEFQFSSSPQSEYYSFGTFLRYVV